MSFFQNPFTGDFIGSWVLSDRQYSVDFKCPRNFGRGDEIVTVWAMGPYNLSGNDADGNPTNILTLSFALNDFRAWSVLPITITGNTQSAVTPQEVITSLQNNSMFASFFTASLDKFEGRNGYGDRVVIRQIKDATRFRFYVQNPGAETALKFNMKAGVAELPTYFTRHDVDQRFNFPDAQNALVLLVPGSFNVDLNVINNAVDAKGNSLNYNGSTIQADWQLIRGRAGIFNFQNIIVDSSDRITQIIEYPAGALTGDMARLVNYTYTGANTKPTQITEVPYTLQSGDLITP